MSMCPKKRALIKLSKKLGVRVKALRRIGLDRDVSPLVRKVLINKLKREGRSPHA